MGDNQFNDCSLCRYRKKGDSQVCARYMTNNGAPCNGDGSGSEDDDTCTLDICPVHCQYPFPRTMYNSDVVKDDKHYGGGFFVKKELLKGVDNLDNLDQYIQSHSSDLSIKPNIRNYTAETKPVGLNLKCGDLIDAEDGIIKGPKAPSASELTEAILFRGNEFLKQGIHWDKLKITPQLEELFGEAMNPEKTEVTILGLTIPLFEKGIELEWWNNKSRNYTEEEIRAAIPESIRELVDLETIHSVTGGVLENVFPSHTIDGMVYQEIYDWLESNDMDFIVLDTEEKTVESEDEAKTEKNQIEELKQKLKPQKFTISSFFGVNVNPSLSLEFEGCVNKLMTTEHDDDEFIKRIVKLKHFSSLGDPDNKDLLNYVHAKIVKFITLDAKEVNKCMDIIYVSDQICQKGLSNNAMKIMGFFTNMNTEYKDMDKLSEKDRENFAMNMNVVTEKLVSYLPDIMLKLIEISEDYEINRCNGEKHKNTELLRKTYNNLFQSPQKKITQGTNDILAFFDDYQQNIFTKTILLTFIVYLLSKIINLFNINYNIKG